MAPRAFWKGYLKLSLVTCPVVLQPAVSGSEKVRFHTLNKTTGNRVRARYLDPETGDVVEDDDIVLGYETEDGTHVTFEDEELDQVALESTRTIDIETFVPAWDIGWIWYDQPHFLAPDDKVGAEAFAVIRAAMADTGTAGIARLVLHRRERAVMLLPHGRGMVLWTLRYGEEVRSERDVLGAEKAEPEKAEAGLKKMLADLIAARTKPWSEEMVADPVQDALLDLIAERQKKRPRRAKASPPPKATGNVVDIRDALKRSLAAEKAGGGKPDGKKR
ncbi:non-homologous end joining protein Ku [Azorhizobium oxalatiphilum]|uniref:Non-homologous end joining protein Ku n=1 Tax=Azorhizobium oxalatiphilum TaxID=980631 RepID=A0A917C8V7_9HYPH|nr:Ku protein [Azorhizobium oxalatiphilum]GGF78542.1 non-homologous end joining protein Ku [Azorhizobium oxalatiphilum]